MAVAAGVARAHLSTHVVDITDRTAVQELPAEVIAVHGAVDGLINNAGIIQPFVPVAELDEATIGRVLDVNLMGTLHMVRAFLPYLAARPEAHLASVSSMGGFFPFPGQTMYGASKAAVRLLTEGLYAELLDTNVQVSVIFPGAVNTGISENSGIETPPADNAGNLPILSPAKAATIMIRGIEKNKLHIYVGPDSRLMSLAIKAAPRPAIRFVQKQMRKRLPAGTVA
jgi:short-subunit dehydrogenase